MNAINLNRCTKTLILSSKLVNSSRNKFYIVTKSITSKPKNWYNYYVLRNIYNQRVWCNEVQRDTSVVNTYTCRTHTCGELRSNHIGLKVTLGGWLQYCRLNKFLLLRDAYGIIQCVTDANLDVDLTKIPLESIVQVEGDVRIRPEEMINKSMPTGEIEVIINKIKVLNNAQELPFNLRSYQKPKEQLRLQHRYVDLRFPEMQYNLRQRSTMLHKMRRFLIERNGFVEVETPTLFCRTPGGAREFVVPTHYSNLFYSLVQSPQQFKQMLMAGGLDRYFQVARCYRDEATRPDRQPEFTQLDIELSFTDRNNVLELIENMLYETYLKELRRPPFRRITYNDAMDLYGTDKPNLKYDLKINNIKHLFPEKSTEPCFGAYSIKYNNKLGKLTAKSRETCKELAKKYKIKIILNEKLNQEFGSDIVSKLELDNVNAIVAIGNQDDCCTCLGKIREMLANLLKSNNLLEILEEPQPLWVVDFPLFLKGDDGRLETCHHPFTAPHPDDMHLLDTEPLKVRSLAYDLVLDGFEVGGGSVRVHDAMLQEKLLKMLDIDPESLSHFLNALKCGCPPHAGIALGIDRLMVIACNAESIRDVIAFPKNHEGKDPLSGAPNPITIEDKKYYHLI